MFSLFWPSGSFSVQAASKPKKIGCRIANCSSGQKRRPPFSIKTSDGDWAGISIDLWRQIASDLNFAFEFRELNLPDMLDGIANGSLDAAVAALTVTPEREQLIDFTHPFYTTGLGIAISSKQKKPWYTAFRHFYSLAFLKVIAILGLLLLSVGALVWWFEHKRNPQQFGGGPAKGIGSGFWWSAVTMTTVGYGDKAPVTFAGRVVGLFWMFAAVMVISSFTAAITSSLTVSQLESPVKGPQDLPKVRVGTIEGTTSADYLHENHIPFRGYETPLKGLRAVHEGIIDTFVYDAPLLRYVINKEFHGILKVLPETFFRQDYGIALKTGSPMRESVNRVLLKKTREPWWQGVLEQYLGP